MDEQIIKRVLSGQTDDFNILIRKYYNELYVFVHNQVNDIELTKDLLQEIFMLLHNKLKSYDSSKASFRTWMYRVANNYTINYLKKKRVFTVTNIDLDYIKDHQTPDVLEAMIQQENVTHVLSIMKKALSKKHYHIMSLYFFSPLTDEEIGMMYHIAPKTIRNVVSLSIQKIREKLEGENHGTI